jgi:hypothetical protein
MEDLVAETVADRELRVGQRDGAGFIAAPPTNLSDQVGRENLTNDDAKALDARAPAADVIVDPFNNIESLKKDDALARLLELEEDQERTFFEMGGVLSMIQKRKWFDPYPSLDEWVEQNTTISRAKARALIQIYDAIVKSGVKWVDVRDIGWTKLRTIAHVLNEESAGYWIEIASNHSKAEVVRLVRESPLGSAKQKPGAQTEMRVKTFRLKSGQIQPIQAAIERAKKLHATNNDSEALETICRDYMEGATTMMPEALVDLFVEHLNTLDKEAAGEIMKAVRERVEHAL